MSTTTTQWCNACNVEHPLSCFEARTNANGDIRYRGVCKKARAEQRKAAIKNAPVVDRSTVPQPEACIKCGGQPPNVEFGWHSNIQGGSWRNVCRRCSSINTDGITHSQAYRQRELERDAEAHRARNAATHLAWARQNPDKVEEQQRLTFSDASRRFKYLIRYLRQKYGVERAQSMIDMNDSSAMMRKMSDPCHYCGHQPEDGGPLNGLDRVEAGGKYDDANTVPCCGPCNSMKLAFDIDEFVQGVRDIAAHRPIFTDVLAKMMAPPKAFGGTAERREGVKDKSDYLTTEQRIELWSNQCYQCGRAPALGIDRVDPALPYIVENCKSCCSLCNYMKKDWSLEEFLGHVGRIHKHTSVWVLRDTRNVLTGVTGPRRPVAAIGRDGKPLIVFPGNSCAERIVGGQTRGVHWKVVDASVYKSQRLSPGVCMHIIGWLRSRV